MQAAGYLSHMPHETRSALARYGVAVGIVALALVLTFPLMRFIDSSAFAVFFVAVMLSAWYGGLGPGLLATGFAVVAIDDWLFPPFGTLTLDRHSLLRLGVFVLVAFV